MYGNNDFSELVGKTLTKIEVNEDNSVMTFYTDSGEEYKLYHDQACCESVYIEDIAGDLNELVGMPILLAEEISSSDDPKDYNPKSDYRESFTWTFYKLVTNKGYATIRWLGESNGYYSESVTFHKFE